MFDLTAIYNCGSSPGSPKALLFNTCMCLNYLIGNDHVCKLLGSLLMLQPDSSPVVFIRRARRDGYRERERKGRYLVRNSSLAVCYMKMTGDESDAAAC